jgi:glyoxylase-like metal-dependent hydrolase (beta-lactamase superfamily II)
MLHIQSFTFNPFQENTYIIFNEHKDCWIVDPGMSNSSEEKVLCDYILANHLVPKAILNTHAHIDHILGIDFVANKYGIPFFLHEKELPILNNASNTAKMFGFQYNGVQTVPKFISEKEALKLGDDTLSVKFVPGHSPGSIAFYYQGGNWIISGDALFAGSIGRTDLMFGDYNTLINSIKTQLLTLAGNTIIYSGHGPQTNILTERESNPFLKD